MHATAREFFESAREAARDAERIRRQLDAMESRALSLGGGGYEGRVRPTPDPDRIGAVTAAGMDVRAILEARRDEDGRVTDAACRILYGPDRRSGLHALVGWPADAIYHHYLALRTWEQVADMMGYSVSHVKHSVGMALELADANGQMWTELGRGMAE